MKKSLIITGANRGLGKAIVDLALKDNDTLIISLSRSLHIEHEKIDKNKLIFIKTNLAELFTLDLVERIAEHIEDNSIIYFFNNAGIISPINKIGNFKPADIETSLRVNINFPVNLINDLVNQFSENKLILANISSGAGKKPIAFWSLYGAAKSYIAMFISILSKENKNITVFNLDPGTMDTDMQMEIRESTFPDQNYFQSLKKDNKLIKPADAARKIFNEINFQI